MPRVSVILPTFNSYSFIKERLETILQQTLSDWECIVIDGMSTDGSWNFLQNKAASDTRFRLYQYPPKGPYDAWNKGIEKAKSEYVYIATSDDTMYTDCLETMVNALDLNPDCDIAHCNLIIIDEHGKPFMDKWQWRQFMPGIYFNGWLDQPHKRLAPHDGILHASLHTVYHSITQLLVRKVLFDKVGAFSTRFGAISDFEWGMRVSLIANTVHIPRPLATWRVHGQQLTQGNKNIHEKIYHTSQLIKLVKYAFRKAVHIKPKLKGISLFELLYPYFREMFYYESKLEKNRYLFLLKWLLIRPDVVYHFLKIPEMFSSEMRLRQENIMWTRKALRDFDLNGHLVNLAS
ncbi:Glycosyltransferase involved in cell wall bisynthesis [Catalinimonas alkaloidigena]|uniref:Glycosyltransferase involved in cell wall bisynthesis n=1 Tax=Catalinimonas alkaloidigena TaxID=1075417 RepID=A0A1G9LHK1_9BACT|nr:glycosyltransferase [Catalinimonas alkaloidigena]SDL61338.1 Glycosyltransferase involved in cell wall bisynthesis [Catalinimonas alkaloidigena]